MQKIYETKIGLYKGVTPRISLETKRLENTKFLPGTKIALNYSKNKITIEIDNQGKKQVTSRRGKQVLDIKSKEIQKAFNGISIVKVTVGEKTIEISPMKEAIEQKRAKTKANKNRKVWKVMDLFCSGGTLAKCFYDHSKFKIEVGIDYDDKKLETYERNFPDVLTWCGDVANVEWNKFKNIDILAMTPSCRPFSRANTTGKKAEKASDGDNTALALFGIYIIRPAIVLLEEVPGYKNSYSYFIFKSTLEKMGYNISERILSAKDFGSLSYRKRLCMVASIKKGFAFLPVQPSFQKKVKDILEIPYKKREWSDMQMHKNWEAKQKAKNNNFVMHFVDEESEAVRHPTTRYYSRQTSSFLINKKGQKSFFTPRELTRIADLPDSFTLPENRSEAAAVIGDGVVYSVFSYVVECINKHLKS